MKLSTNPSFWILWFLIFLFLHPFLQTDKMRRKRMNLKTPFSRYLCALQDHSHLTKTSTCSNYSWLYLLQTNTTGICHSPLILSFILFPVFSVCSQLVSQTWLKNPFFFFWSPNTFFPITSPSLRFFRFSALPSLYFAYCLFYFVGFNCATVLTVSSSVYLPWILSLFSIHVVFLDVSPIFWSNFSSEPSHVFLCGAQLSLLLFPTGELCLQPASS